MLRVRERMRVSATLGSRRRGVGLVATAVRCWSSGRLIARLVAADPWTTVFSRSLFCAAFLGGRLALVVHATGSPASS